MFQTMFVNSFSHQFVLATVLLFLIVLRYAFAAAYLQSKGALLMRVIFEGNEYSNALPAQISINCEKMIQFRALCEYKRKHNDSLSLIFINFTQHFEHINKRKNRRSDYTFSIVTMH